MAIGYKNTRLALQISQRYGLKAWRIHAFEVGAGNVIAWGAMANPDYWSDQEAKSSDSDGGSWTAPRLQFASDLLASADEDEDLESALGRIMDEHGLSVASMCVVATGSDGQPELDT